MDVHNNQAMIYTCELHVYNEMELMKLLKYNGWELLRIHGSIMPYAIGIVDKI